MPPKLGHSANVPSDQLPGPANYTRSTLLENAMDGPRGPQSALEGAMMAVRSRVFAGLTNTDLNNLRLTSRTMYDRLSDQDLVQGELKDQCDEFFEVPGGGGIEDCENFNLTRRRLYYCQGEQYGVLSSQLGRGWEPDHGTGSPYHTVCENCKNRWPTRVGRLHSFRNWMSRFYDEYRAAVCVPCAVREEDLHPSGHDGCSCEQNYARSFLCRHCSDNAYRFMKKTAALTDRRIKHAIVRNDEVHFNGPRRKHPACMCGWRDAIHSNAVVPGWPAETRQCKVCTGYISVPKNSIGAHPFGEKGAQKRKRDNEDDEDDEEKGPKSKKTKDNGEKTTETTKETTETTKETTDTNKKTADTTKKIKTNNKTNQSNTTSTKTQTSSTRTHIPTARRSRRPNADGPLMMLDDRRGKNLVFQTERGFAESPKEPRLR